MSMIGPPKIFEKMFGKGPRQLQADPTLDLRKCDCCNCEGTVKCQSCLTGAAITATGACCQSGQEMLVFEIERPGDANGGGECCPQTTPLCPARKRCCVTIEQEEEDIRFLYEYYDQYFRIDYKAKRDFPPLCSYCDQTSLPVSNCDPSIDPGEEMCLPGCNQGPPQCQSSFGQPEGCRCQGSGAKFDISYSKLMPLYRKKRMEELEYYQWLIDIICYDGGNIIANPWFIAIGEPGSQSAQWVQGHPQAGSLYNRLIGVVHCEHWWKLVQGDCQNPEHGKDGPLLAPAGSGNWGTEPVNTSCITPLYWIYACSGVPLFDFDITEAIDKGFFQGDDAAIFLQYVTNEETPPQSLMRKLAEAKLTITGDWRLDAIAELQELKGRTYTKNAYSDVNIDECDDYEHFLGPVRKRYWRPNQNLIGLPPDPAFLDPRKCRNATPAKNMQFPFFRDPWGGNYPPAPNQNSTPEQIQEYEDYLTWRDSQWLYLHARPGGWDWVCAGYCDSDVPGTCSVLKPDLPRRFMSSAISCNSNEAGIGCLNFTGYPMRYTEQSLPDCTTQRPCSSGDPNNPLPVVGCGDQCSCLAIACAAQEVCTAYPERGGGPTPCDNYLIGANCDGIHFVYHAPVQYKSVDICQHPNCAAGNDTTACEFGESIIFDIPSCAYTNHAYLYKLNVGSGEYDTVCPYYCKTLQNPIPVKNIVPNLSAVTKQFKDLCDYWTTGCELAVPCCGSWCFPSSGNCCGGKIATPSCIPEPNQGAQAALHPAIPCVRPPATGSEGDDGAIGTCCVQVPSPDPCLCFENVTQIDCSSVGGVFHTEPEYTCLVCNQNCHP